MLPVLAVLLAAVCFGTTGTAQALGPEVDAVVLGAARIAVGGLTLAVVAVAATARARRPAPRLAPAAPARVAPSTTSPPALAPTAPPAPAPVASPLGPRPRALSSRTAGLVALGALGVLAYQPAFFAGTARNGVAVGTVIALGSAPVLTGLATWAVRGVRPGRAWLLATALATAGVALLGLAPGAAVGGAPAAGLDLGGVLASLGAGAAYALYTLAGAGLIGAGWAPTTSMGAMFGAAGVVGAGVLTATALAGSAGSTGLTSLTTPAGLAMVLWLGLVTTTLAYVLFGHGLARLGAPTVATLTLAEPLTATVLGLGVLGERLSGGAVAGLVVLAAGLVVLAASARQGRARREQQHDDGPEHRGPAPSARTGQA